ncbi:MAG: hypothetical protein HY078_15155 [Elusimicrobia bacterium]|nr:hypothetical protein [Elusimicrobiota bacterium]
MTGARARLTLALLALAAALPGRARADFGASGYVKTLYSYTRSPIDRRVYWLDMSRARLTLDSSAGFSSSVLEGLAPGSALATSDAGKGPRFRVHVDYDHEVRAGSYYQSADHRFFGMPEPASYFDMEQTISTGGSYTWRHLLYRGWVGVESETALLRFGRQRIAWGTGKLWNPVDVLNPYQPTSLERDERRGVDSIYARSAFGNLGQGEAAYALGDRWASSDLLVRMKGHAGRADVSLIGGKVATSTASWMLGSDLSSDLWDGNLHGEWSYTDLKTRTPFWRALIGYEYSFSSSPPVSWLKDVWFVAEYFHNGAGVARPGRYRPQILLSGRDVALARNYGGFGFTKDLHPLLKFELYQLVNIDDGSHFFSPSLSWNAVKNLYLSAGLQRFGGSIVSEYGRLPNIAWAQGQFYF